MDEILNIISDACKSSGEFVVSRFRKENNSSEKTSNKDIVTDADFMSQNIIKDVILKKMMELGYDNNDIGFVAEESNQDSMKKYNFVIDPLDGTTNFEAGIPWVGISVAYCEGKNIISGVVYEPFSKKMYSAKKGLGSFVDNQKLNVSEKDMKKWILATHLNSIDDSESQFEQYKYLYPKVRGMRNLGSVALDFCMAADNVIDVVLNKGCFIWDLAAAGLIFEEAGGEIFDYDGNKLEYDWENIKKKYKIIGCKGSYFEKLK